MRLIDKDYTGNSKSIYACLGASNHAIEPRQTFDYYATEPKATQLLCDVEHFSKNVWECACGELHMSNVLRHNGYDVKSSDIVPRCEGVETIDFLEYRGAFDGDIITNPPYKYARQFVEKALDVIPKGHKVAMFLKLTFLESKSRKSLFEKYPFKTLYVSSSRLRCAKNGDFAKADNSTAVAYGWYIWEKGFSGSPTVKWIN